MENRYADNMRYYIVLMREDGLIDELYLPEKKEGFYKFKMLKELVSISAVENSWYLSCVSPAYILNGDIYNFVKINDNNLYVVELEDIKYNIFVNKLFKSDLRYENYYFKDEVKLLVGNSQNDNIICDSKYLTPSYFILTRKNGIWFLRDNGSKYGVYVNSEKFSNKKLKLGDTIYVPGMKMIIGIKNIAICSLNNMIRINSEINFEFIEKSTNNGGVIGKYYNNEENESDESYFNRLPRLITPKMINKVSVEGPPMSIKNADMPLFLRMGSSMFMGGTAALVGNFSSLITSFLFPFMTSKYSEKQKIHYENERSTKYTEYLQYKRNEINNLNVEEKKYIQKKYPSINQIFEISKSKNRLWERRPNHDDFAHISLGCGDKLSDLEISYPKKHFQMHEDNLEKKMYELVEYKYYLYDIPIVKSLIDYNYVSLVGSKEDKLLFLNNLMVQLTYFHSYEELKVIFLMNKEVEQDLTYIRYLNHIWNDDYNIRFMAADESESYFIGDYIKNKIEDDTKENEKLETILKKRPYYIIFALDKKLYESHEIYKTIVQSECNKGFSIVFGFDDYPKEVKAIIEVKEGKVDFTSILNSNDNISCTLYNCEKEHLYKYMKNVSNIKLKSKSTNCSLPESLTFLEMFNVDKVEHLNSVKRWGDNDPTRTLSTLIGVALDGTMFNLDLHEKAHGPHGLIAGMTGSGKSEFIITYILSLAVNYHPHEVAFVLIDYKGGGLTGAFENVQTGVRLPHLVGTITNLDGATIHRSLISIESELVRRQKKFNIIKNEVNEGTMNIYTYQKLYRKGIVKEPMPHLFIISDEFAELKQQQPEFMSKLISIARIGRSLGVHLILATQKPSGVVDDQIRSNAKFKICLKVQEKTDSMDMLKRPEAAELKNVGRFYLQVGYNEYFAIGQSGWAGANYDPSDISVNKINKSVEFINNVGQVVTKSILKSNKTKTSGTQVVKIVKYLSDICKNQNLNIKQLVDPELDSHIDITSIDNEKIKDMTINLGMVDDPSNLLQYPYSLDLRKPEHILILGESGYGKTSIVQSMLYLLTKELSSNKLNYYILDYNSGMLKMFDDLPHCGVVLTDADEDYIEEFFNIINKIVDERKKMLAKLNVDSFEEASKMVEIPLVLIVIDNYTGFVSSKKGERFGYTLNSVLKNCLKFGVKFIITASHSNEVPFKIKQEITKKICLKLKDKFDYTDVLGSSIQSLPKDMPGRALCKIYESVLEVQFGIIYPKIASKERNDMLINNIKKIDTSDSSYKVERIVKISDNIEYGDFIKGFFNKRFPIGYSLVNKKPVSLPFKQFTSLSIYMGNTLGTKSILENICLFVKKENMDIYVLKRNNESMFKEDLIDLNNYSIEPYVFECNMDSLLNFRNKLLNIIDERKQMIDNDIKLNHNEEIFEYMIEHSKPILLLVENFADFCNSLDFITSIMFTSLFQELYMYNIYCISLFEPNDYKNLTNETLYYSFNKDKLVILLGGNYESQDIIPLVESLKTDKVIRYDNGIMHYRDNIYPIVMPCGELLTNVVNEDDANIFGGM